MSHQPISTQTPASLGYRMPAEWEPHAATWLSWPYNTGTWEGRLEGAEAAFVRIIEALSASEHVHLLVPDSAVRMRALSKLRGADVREDRLLLHTIETGDVWIRDYGPIFVARDSGGARSVAWTKWRYNAYGNKYADLLVGDGVPDRMPLAHLPRFDGGIVLEGGSIDVNGAGTLLTTESCLLSRDRNPSLTKEQIEGCLRAHLGVTNILWLSAGIEGDDTTGHVDDLARFVDRTTVVTAVEEDPRDANHAPLRENAERLACMADEQGVRLTVRALPMPRASYVDGRRMAASYANFYVANSAVLVPVYCQPSDDVALQILRECFPGRAVIGIDCRELIWGCGSIHCATQQQPAGGCC